MAFNAFLKIDGVQGEATAKGVENQIEIHSFSWGANNSVTVGSGSTGISGGKVSPSSFQVTKKTESSSADLFSGCCTGKHFSSAEVNIRKATGDGGQKTFVKFTFTDVMVSSIHWSGPGGEDDSPLEVVNFAFAKVKIEYSKQDSSSGSVSPSGNATYDFTKESK